MTIIETEQSRETKFTEIARGPFILRFISYRKSEDAKLNLRSEDYIVSELNPDKAVFALCDGVGSSFYGDIGSQILGETLLDWLSKVSPPNNLMLGKNESANQWIVSLSQNLHAELKHKTELATTIIQKKEDYLDFFPSAYINMKLSEKAQIRASYSSRITMSASTVINDRLYSAPLK